MAAYEFRTTVIASMANAPFGLTRSVYRVSHWIAASAATAIIAPYVALSTYTYLQLDDAVLYTKVKTAGIFGTWLWYNEMSMGRFTPILAYSAFVYFFDLLGLNPWDWARLTSCAAFSVVFAGYWVWFRVFTPLLRPTLLVVMSVFPIAAVMPFYGAEIHDAFQPLNQSIYFLSFGLLAACIAVGGRIVADTSTPRFYFIAFPILLFAFSGAHEVNLVTSAILLAGYAGFLLRWNGAMRPFSSLPGLSFFRVGGRLSLRQEFDNWRVIACFAIAAILLAVSATIQLESPSVEARAEYWPARVSLWQVGITAFPMTGELILRSISFDRPYVLLLACLAFTIGRAFPMPVWLRGRARLLLLMPCLLALTTAQTLYTLTRYTLEKVPIRIENYAMSLVVLAWFGLALYLAAIGKLNWATPRAARASGIVFFVLFVVALSRDPWYREAIEEATHTGYRQAQGIERRTQMMAQGKGEEIQVPELPLPPRLLVMGTQHLEPTEKYYQELLAIIYGQKRIMFVPCGLSERPFKCHYVENPGGVPREW